MKTTCLLNYNKFDVKPKIGDNIYTLDGCCIGKATDVDSCHGIVKCSIKQKVLNPFFKRNKYFMTYTAQTLDFKNPFLQYKRQTIKIAKELKYNDFFINAIINSKNVDDIQQILVAARNYKFKGE